MRALISEFGGFAFCVTEFLRVAQNVPATRAFRVHAPEFATGCRTPVGLPVQVQLLGGDPETLARAAQVAVVAGGPRGGPQLWLPRADRQRPRRAPFLLEHPARIRSIVETVRGALPAAIPVSAKLRLGWDDARAIHVNAGQVAEGGAAWVTIHGRTRCQGYRPPVFWKPIGQVRARLGIPVVANGDIWTVEDLRRCRDETGCHHFMLGRGALASPGLIGAAARELGIPGTGGRGRFDNTRSEWLPLLRRFAELCQPLAKSRTYTVRRIKQWLGLANHDGRLPWFEALKTCESLEELLGDLSVLADVERAA